MKNLYIYKKAKDMLRAGISIRGSRALVTNWRAEACRIILFVAYTRQLQSQLQLQLYCGILSEFETPEDLPVPRHFHLLYYLPLLRKNKTARALARLTATAIAMRSPRRITETMKTAEASIAVYATRACALKPTKLSAPKAKRVT